ncbi:hypothetical protein G7Y89_g6209 [Cudoniella acicularis]|uniref:Uncharacterized protein n=1 Tax=Cudoniella acicularis TaxID=354080 RepID=A0A8H4RKX7_9HELO|nr:hypothetical protein G7Y89_g6209 [Cudoniella acicularis]
MKYDKLVGGEVDDSGEFSFTHKPAFSTPKFTAIDICIVMMYNDDVFVLRESEKANLCGERVLAPPRLMFQWQVLYDYKWNSDYSSDSDSDDLIPPMDYYPRHPRWLFRQDRQAASKKRPASSTIEDLPVWAWDVAGEWTITAQDIAKELGVEEWKSLSMTIKMSYNPLHNRDGRQLWAQFDFGGKMYEIMRFCPIKANLYPFVRWRGGAERNRHHEIVNGSDDWKGSFTFSKSEDGRLLLNGEIMYANWSRSFEAVKTKDAPPPKGNEKTIIIILNEETPKADQGLPVYKIGNTSDDSSEDSSDG